MLSTTTPALAVNTPPDAIVPETSRFPFTSIVVAAICISVSATRSNCPSALEFI